MTKSLSSRIQDLGNEIPPKLRRAAYLLGQKPELVMLSSLRTLAEHANVSTSTLMRLTRLLGYQSFDDLRMDTLKGLQSGDPGFSSKAQAVGRRAHGTSGGLHGGVLERAAEQAVTMISSTAALNAPGSIEAFSEACLAPRRLFVLGLRSCHALSYSFAYVERFIRPDVVHVCDVGGATIDVLGDAQPEDALCIFSQVPYARLAVELAEFAHGRGVPLLAMTDSASAPYCKWTEHVLLFDAHTPSFFPSQLGCLMLIEQVALMQVASSTTDVMKNIELRERMLQAVGAYVPVPSGSVRVPARTARPTRVRR